MQKGQSAHSEDNMMGEKGEATLQEQPSKKQKVNVQTEQQPLHDNSPAILPEEEIPWEVGLSLSMSSTSVVASPPSSNEKKPNSRPRLQFFSLSSDDESDR